MHTLAGAHAISPSLHANIDTHTRKSAAIQFTFNNIFGKLWFAMRATVFMHKHISFVLGVHIVPTTESER